MSEAKKHKILTAAQSVFVRYGYKRVNMNDIAEAAGVSRAALYVLFENKEEIFVGVYRQWLDETLVLVKKEIERSGTRERKLLHAFEIWAVRPFEMIMTSPEAKELAECSFDFAQDALRQGYQKFEAMIAPVLAPPAKKRPAKAHMTPERTAHVLSSAVRGFKQAATSPDELRRLIKELLWLSLA
jgi:TetR/AcrR family transcriptional regulator of autoinduction and epiphytic fitness